jgi:hypothetical protein
MFCLCAAGLSDNKTTDVLLYPVAPHLLGSTYNFDNIPVFEYVVFLNPHLAACIYCVQKSFTYIRMYLVRKIMGS